MDFDFTNSTDSFKPIFGPIYDYDKLRNLQAQFDPVKSIGEDKKQLIVDWDLDNLNFKLEFSYEPPQKDKKEQVRMLLTMPDQMWISIGFGTQMVDTDMIAWHAQGDEDSYVTDYYSTKRNTPGIDASQDLLVYKRAIAAKEIAGGYDAIQFLVYRDLDTGDTAEDYVIELGKQMNMVWGIRVSDPFWQSHEFRGNWDLQIDQTTGNSELKVPDQIIDRDSVPIGTGGQIVTEDTLAENCFSNTWDSFNLKTCYDKELEEVVFTAIVPDNTWLGIGFGNSMIDVDMIVWRNIEGLAESHDLWSTSNGQPAVDDVQDILTTTRYDANAKVMEFTSRRKLDTGDSTQDFIIELDQEVAMSYAFKKGTKGFGKHETHGFWKLSISKEGSITEIYVDELALLRDDKIEAHGWVMWAAWFVCGILLLVTKRYAKKTWFFSHVAHAIIGLFVIVGTIFQALKVTDWNPTKSMHNGMGTLVVFLTIFLAFSGSITASMQQFHNGDKNWSKQEKAQLIGKIHRYSGYTMLLLGNATIMSGVGYYFEDKLRGDERKVLGFFSFVVFAILVAIFEGMYRIRNKYSMGHVLTPNVKNAKSKVTALSPAQVDAQVEKGKSLVIFDNLVLDLNGFERMHPGGKFNLVHNYGRDISKFFFGGYSLVNIPNKRPYAHSQSALDIVESLVIGVIKGQELVNDELFRMTNKNMVNKDAATFTFTSVDNEPVTNLKQWYSDPSMIGRHFLVFSVANPGVKRHYTICSSMQPEIRSELLTMANDLLAGRPLNFNGGYLDGRDRAQINLTLKNYETKRGLATKIHSTHFDEEGIKKQQVATTEEISTDNAYFIKGPMGKGLQIQPYGSHVAFCAGTGALVFLDLVAHLLIKNCFESDGKKIPKEMNLYEAGFQFHLFVAFEDRDQAIGLELIEALEQVNQKLGLNNFKATVRLSKPTSGPKLPRWNPLYIEEQLTPMAGNIQRIWVVGPPAVNEMFDKTLENLMGNLKITKTNIEIM